MQVNPVIVVLVSLAAWSAFEYASRSISYKNIISHVKSTTEYKQNLKKLKEEKLAEMERTGEVKPKRNGKRTRKDIESVEVDESELIDRIKIHGSYRKPKVSELAIVQVWFIPYYFVRAIMWQVRWIKKYRIDKEEYSQEDKEYIVRGILNISASTWESLEEKKKEKIMARELWIPENEAKLREQMRQASIRAAANRDPDWD